LLEKENISSLGKSIKIQGKNYSLQMEKINTGKNHQPLDPKEYRVGRSLSAVLVTRGIQQHSMLGYSLSSVGVNVKRISMRPMAEGRTSTILGPWRMRIFAALLAWSVCRV
jgi:hypothetical protein